MGGRLNGKEPVLIILGQSNGVGVAPKSGAPTFLQGTISKAEIWNDPDWDVLSCGSTNQAADSSSFGPEMSLAYYYLRRSKAKKIRIIKHTVSNTSLNVGWKVSTGTNYADAKTKIDAALATLTPGTYYIAGILWVQGENDALSASVTASNNYPTNLTDLVTDLRTEYGSDVPFVISQLGYVNRNSYYYQDNVREAQNSVSAAMGNVKIIRTDDLTFNADVIHFGADAQVSIGARAAGAFFDADSYVENRPPAYSEITLWIDPSTPNTCLDGSNVIVTPGNGVQTVLGRQKAPLCNVGQTTGAQKPTVTAGVLNGRQGLVFDGSADNLSAATMNPSLLFGTTAGTIAIISKTSLDKAHTIIFINAGTNAIVNTATKWFQTGVRNNFFFDWANASGGRLTGTTGAVVGTADLHEFYRKSGNTAEVLRNGTSLGTGASTGTVASLTGTLRIGYDGSNYFNGALSEIVCWPRELTTLEKTQLRSYVNTKHGLTV